MWLWCRPKYLSGFFSWSSKEQEKEVVQKRFSIAQKSSFYSSSAGGTLELAVEGGARGLPSWRFEVTLEVHVAWLLIPLCTLRVCCVQTADTCCKQLATLHSQHHEHMNSKQKQILFKSASVHQKVPVMFLFLALSAFRDSMLHLWIWSDPGDTAFEGKRPLTVFEFIDPAVCICSSWCVISPANNSIKPFSNEVLT